MTLNVSCDRLNPLESSTWTTNVAGVWVTDIPNHLTPGSENRTFDYKCPRATGSTSWKRAVFQNLNRALLQVPIPWGVHSACINVIVSMHLIRCWQHNISVLPIEPTLTLQPSHSPLQKAAVIVQWNQLLAADNEIWLDVWCNLT